MPTSVPTEEFILHSAKCSMIETESTQKNSWQVAIIVITNTSKDGMTQTTVENGGIARQASVSRMKRKAKKNKAQVHTSGEWESGTRQEILPSTK